MMIMKRSVFTLFIVLLFGNRIGAQEVNIIDGNQLKETVQTTVVDTFPLLELDEAELDKIPDLRAQFEEQNKSYSTPTAPSENLLRFLNKDEINLSPEAQYWVDWVRDPSTGVQSWQTLRDTTIVNPLFTTLLFKGGLIPRDLQLYDKNFVKKQRPCYSLYKPDTTLFQDEVLRNNLQETAYDYVRINHPELFRYSMRDIPTDIVQTDVIEKTTYEPDLITVEENPNEAFSDVDAPTKFIPERRYWTSTFESSLQFAQNYISPNWSAGGSSNLNLTNLQKMTYTYSKDKIQFTNELNWQTNVYTAPNDTLRSYKISNDVFRISSNFGYQAFNKWYYTLDATFQTQLFSKYQENTNTKLATFLSPFTINVGLGMKYELSKTFANKRNKSLALSINLAPLSYTFMYSTDENIDLSAHGFKADAETGIYSNKLSKFGSTINSSMTFKFNRNVTWYSRFYYFTSYDRILAEFENRLTMAISRFFSTTLSLNLRYDDAVAKTEDFDTHLQVNELISFGFNYKW